MLCSSPARGAIAIAILLLACTGCGPARPDGSQAARPGAAARAKANQRFDAIAGRYIAQYAAAHPVQATSWGIHDHDRAVDDFRPAAIARRIAQLEAMLAEVAAIERQSLGGHAYYDYQLLDHALRAELLELEEVRMWQRNPMRYSRIIAGAIATLVDRAFAPLPRRLEALIARLQAIPAVIAAARQNLRDVPQLWARLGVEQARGTARFMRGDLVAALKAQGLAQVAPALAARWSEAHRQATAQVAAFADWLAAEVLPSARGDFRLGKDLFERKLRYEEHVAMSVDELRAMNESEIRRYHQWVAREAAKIDKSKSPAEVMAAITSRHPSPDALLATARTYVEDTRQFVIRRNLLTLPSNSVPIVRPTPKYARTGFASMSVPGPFETVAKEAYYNITNVDPAWHEAKKRQHLTYFNFPGLLGITVHEAFPGHYVQLLYRPHIPSDLRKVLSWGTLVEGWAHYTEQMMIDEGLGGGDPKVRLGQLRRALQRHARWYAGLALHVDNVPLADVVTRYGQIAFFAQFPARRESERGSYNPTYLYYALGRMQILELRKDYREHVEAAGGTFSLRDFHDRLLRLGLPPTLAREALIGRYKQ